MSSSVAVIGSGYVGTVVAGCLAHIGHSVVGVEADPAKLVPLREGKAPFFEPGLDELLAAGIADGRLRFTDDFADAMAASEVVFVCVGTPSGPDGLPDMTAMIGVARSIAANLTDYHVLVNKSTVPVGSGRWLGSMIEDVADDPSAIEGLYAVVSNPEFLREGSAVGDYLHPDRVVLGSDDPRALDILAEVYGPILRQQLPGEPAGEPVPLVRTDLVTAEMTKYASNAFLATKISFANEISRLCELVGADVTEVTAGMGLDSRIGPRFLQAGLGWGGSCFGKDVLALISTAGDYGFQAKILESAMQVNMEQRRHVVDTLLRDLRTLRGARIGLLGLAFKPETDDLRDSPAIAVADELVTRGCFVTAYDPVVDRLRTSPQVRIATSAEQACAGADAIVVATDWVQFLDLDLAALRETTKGDLFFDGRNMFDPEAVEAAGFRYRGIGRGRPRRPSAERVAEHAVEASSSTR